MKANEQAMPSFHLGITMAGAVSAGAYTSGVMDYLFELLDVWEQAKNGVAAGADESLIPRHNVVIDAMGGASAGGMVTTMSVIHALKGDIKPMRDTEIPHTKTGNIFYDNWVFLDDDDDSRTFAKLWDTSDLKSGRLTSLLNTSFIDNITDRTFEVKGNLADKLKTLPSYISPDLDVILSHCLLQGIPLEINFTTPVAEEFGSQESTSHCTFEHFTLSHYKLNHCVLPDEHKYFMLDPFDEKYREILKYATKATGAFPIGLQLRKFDDQHFSDKYIQSIAERIIFSRFENKTTSQNTQINWENFPSSFNLTTVDGGTVNNEPFGEILNILKERYEDFNEKTKPLYGLIMVDPLPDVVDRKIVCNDPEDLLEVIPMLIGTLREQAKVKRAETLDAYSNNYYRGVISPRRWIAPGEKDDFPIACESIGAFGGFLDKSFRHHDFFLGRDNARNFFRNYFVFEYRKDTDPAKCNIHPIHEHWTPEMVEMFKVERKGVTFLPIIPDINMVIEKQTKGMISPFVYSVKHKPKFDPRELFEHRARIERRFERILTLVKEKNDRVTKANLAPVTDRWLEKYYHESGWDKYKGELIGKLFNRIFDAVKGGLSRKITRAIMRSILTDLEKMDLLDTTIDQHK